MIGFSDDNAVGNLLLLFRSIVTFNSCCHPSDVNKYPILDLLMILLWASNLAACHVVRGKLLDNS